MGEGVEVAGIGIEKANQAQVSDHVLLATRCLVVCLHPELCSDLCPLSTTWPQTNIISNMASGLMLRSDFKTALAIPVRTL